MFNKKIIILRGLPASGKSTFVKNNHLHDYVLSMDILRKMFCAPISIDNGECFHISQDYNKQVAEMFMTLLKARLDNGSFTVVDNTNLSARGFNEIIDLAKSHGFEILVVDFNTPMNECIERDKLRTFAVGEDVIRRMANYKKVEFENTIDSNNDESFQKFIAI
jgi:2,3-cyclic nucleotide 3-phosphodiesterase